MITAHHDQSRRPPGCMRPTRAPPRSSWALCRTAAVGRRAPTEW